MKLKRIFIILMVAVITFNLPMMLTKVEANSNDGIATCGLTYLVSGYYTGNMTNPCFSQMFTRSEGSQVMLQLTVSGSTKLKVVITGYTSSGSKIGTIYSGKIPTGGVQTINILPSSNQTLNSSAKVKVEFYFQSILTETNHIEGTILY